MKKLFFLTFLIPVSGLAQPNLPKNEADSLWAIWKDESQPDTNRTKAMFRISWYGYLFTKPDSAIYYSEVLYQFAKSKNLLFDMSVARNTQGSANLLMGKYEESIVYLEEALELDEKNGDLESQASKHVNLGSVYSKLGNLPLAVDHFTKGMKLMEKSKNYQGMAASYMNLAGIYKVMKMQEERMALLKKAVGIEKKIKDPTTRVAILINMGGALDNQGSWEEAKDYFKRALQLSDSINYQVGRQTAYINLAQNFFSAKEYSSSLEYYDKALSISREIKDLSTEAEVQIGIAMVLLETGKKDLALEKALLAESIVNSVNSLEQRSRISELLYKIYSSKNNASQALFYYEQFIRFRDSLTSETNRNEVIRQEYKFQYDKQTAADSVQREQEKILEKAKHEAELQTQRAGRNALIVVLSLVVVFSIFLYNRFRVIRKQRNIISAKEAETREQKDQLEYQKELIEEKHKEILDSINYAKRIQAAILPPNRIVKEYLSDSFILYKPKDIVAGDFYWLEHSQGRVLFAACDCTGHGVPGAMVSVVCNNGLNRSVREHGLTDPGKILDKTREIVITEFEKSEEEVKDGMDISLVSLSNSRKGENADHVASLQWSGANNPLWIIRKGASVLEEIKPDKQPIGKYADPKPFSTHALELRSGDTLYIFTDGYSDQFGGEKGKKFKASNFKELLLSIQQESMESQQRLIDEAFERWKGKMEQVDDVCVIGVRV